ncbi:MAG: hypothetical protein QXM71_00630 [Thermofilum sp.]
MPSKRMIESSLRLLVSALTILLVPVIALLFAEQGSRSFHVNLYFNLFSAAVAVLVLREGLLLLKSCAGDPPHVLRPWLFVTAGLAVWTFSEISWAALYAFYGGPQVESVAYGLWTAGYPLLMVGLWYLAKPFASQLKEIKTLKILAPAVVITAAAASLAAAAVASTLLKGGSPTGRLLTLLYIFLDAALLFTSLYAAMTFRPGVMGSALSLIALAFIAFCFADLLYYAAGTFEFLPADLLYATSYVLLLAGLRSIRELFRER